jgi:TonB-dependent SusC/RagA subfamily outer membrane receptor
MRSSTDHRGGRGAARVAARALAGALAAALAAVAAACAGGRAGGAPPDGAKPEPPSTMPSGANVGDRDVQNQRALRLEEMFAGRFPGVQVYAQGGGVLIRVRGATTISGSTEPLFVLDGQPLAQGNGGVIDVNPNDIARIEVLKSPTDLAMYGSRSGNGVVRITTKRGRRPTGGA